MLIKQETLLGRGSRAEGSRLREPRELLSTELAVSGFRVMRSVSGQSSCLAHVWPDSGSFLVAHASLSKMASSVRTSGRLVASPLLWPLPNPPG